MALDSLEMSTWLPVTPAALFAAWLDSKQHAAFTGAGASVEPRVNGAFDAWDGYITGRNLELEPAKRIVQAWSTSEFPEGHAPSRLEVLLAPDAGGTRITLLHSEIPVGQGKNYESGWEEFYFAPMRRHFVAAAPKKSAPAKKKSAPAKKKAAPVKKKAAPVKKKAAPAKKKAAPAKKKAAPAKKKAAPVKKRK